MRGCQAAQRRVAGRTRERWHVDRHQGTLTVVRRHESHASRLPPPPTQNRRQPDRRQPDSTPLSPVSTVLRTRQVMSLPLVELEPFFQHLVWPRKTKKDPEAGHERLDWLKVTSMVCPRALPPPHHHLPPPRRAAPARRPPPPRPRTRSPREGVALLLAPQAWARRRSCR